MRDTEYFLYTLISLITLLTLLLFVPHTLLSSSDDTPLIFYRYLMILAGLLLFLYNIIINFNGIHDTLSFEIKTLCIFLDWLHLLIVIPLALPFINNIISAAQTASQISLFTYQSNKLSLVSQNSDTDHKNKNQNRTFSKIFITLLTFLFWCATIICQILSWYKNDSFYKKILLEYITCVYISYTSLFVGMSFISLYRQVNKVQKSFIRLQQSITLSEHNSAHKNDNSVSAHNDVFPQLDVQKNEEVIQNLSHHKHKFVKIAVFVAVLACLDLYSTFSLTKQQQKTLNTPYNQHPLFPTTFNYIISMLKRLLIAVIIYFWLAIDNLYSKKAPIDSIGYLVYAHCCCKCKFCFCFPCLHLLCTDTEKQANIDIEMVEIPKIIHFKDSVSKIPIPVHVTSSNDDYADIDNITMFQPNLPEKKMNIKIIASSKENNFDENDSKKITKNLHAYNNSVNTMTLPTDNNSPVAACSHTNVSQMINMNNDNDEFSVLPTYEEKIHANHGLMGEQNETNFSEFGSIDNSPHLFPSLSPNSFPFASLLKKRAETIDILEMKIENSNSGSESEADFNMIMGIKAIVYSFEILIDVQINMDDIDNGNIDKYETKIKRLTQHLLIMNENIRFVYILSNKINHENIMDLMQIIHLKNVCNGGENIIGYDHEWIADCKKNMQLILLCLIKKLNIENSELLFVSNGKLIGLVEEINVCQTYNIDDIKENKNNSNESECSDGTLKGKDLMFLESQVLASI